MNDFELLNELFTNIEDENLLEFRDRLRTLIANSVNKIPSSSEDLSEIHEYLNTLIPQETPNFSILEKIKLLLHLVRTELDLINSILDIQDIPNEFNGVPMKLSDRIRITLDLVGISSPAIEDLNDPSTKTGKLFQEFKEFCYFKTLIDTDEDSKHAND